MAADGLLSQYSSLGLVTLKENVWPAELGLNAPQDLVAFVAGDGGLVENYGVFEALRRGVARLAVHVNCQTPLSSASAWDPCVATLCQLVNLCGNVFLIVFCNDRQSRKRVCKRPAPLQVK